MLSNITLSREQVTAIFQLLLTIGGAILVTNSVHRGVFSATDWQTITGAILTIAPIFWSAFSNRQSARIESVTRIPEVQRVIVNDKLLANRLDNDKVVHTSNAK